jgi:hypothetical protein
VRPVAYLTKGGQTKVRNFLIHCIILYVKVGLQTGAIIIIIIKQTLAQIHINNVTNALCAAKLSSKQISFKPSSKRIYRQREVSG